MHSDPSTEFTSTESIPDSLSFHPPHSETVVSSNVATEDKSTSLLMTCQVLVQ